jgi:hypothetical protein
VTAATRWASEVVEDDMSKTHDSHERQVWFVAEHLVDTPLIAHEEEQGRDAARRPTPDQRRVDAFRVRN